MGLLVSPVAILRGDARGRIVMVTLIATIAVVPLALVVRGAALYDELRQLLFLFPLCMMAGLIAIDWLSARLAVVAGVGMLLLSAADQVRLHPYQYTWLNEAARFADVDRMFERDYWGTVGQELSVIAGRNGLFDRTRCVYAEPLHLFQPFLEREGFSCAMRLLGERQRSEPVQVALYYRGPWLHRPGCDVLYEVARTYPLSGRRVRFGALLTCRTPYRLGAHLPAMAWDRSVNLARKVDPDSWRTAREVAPRNGQRRAVAPLPWRMARWLAGGRAGNA
jgi:hypothetical protein